MSPIHDIPKELIDELAVASQRVEHELAEEQAAPHLPGIARRGLESPFGELQGDEAIKAYSGDQWGAFSIEDFPGGIGDLSYTHDDAWGWLEYLKNFAPENFWVGDGGVQTWQYYETYDNWQDTYGMDAVMAAYHSGHGSMDGNGVFWAPVGSDWAGTGVWVSSNNMRLGNEQVRYIWWSTCLSLRVLGGHNPIRTWSPANLGFRMLFGYETVSVDDPDYGRAFWNHWRAGKSFSTAWLDASWYDISTHQAPSAMAVGANSTEAWNRLYYERYFDWNAASTAWWQWRWYYAAAAATAQRAPRFELPRDLLVARLERPTVNERYVNQVLARHDVPVSGDLQQISAGPLSGFLTTDGDARVAVESDGSYDITFRAPNRENRTALPLRSAVRTAQNYIQQQGLARDLTFDRVMLKFDAGGTEKGDGAIDEPHVTETVVQFSQVVNGLPILPTGRGHVSITIDNDSNVTGLRNTTRAVERLTDRPKRVVVAPEQDAPSITDTDAEQLLEDAWLRRMRGWVVKGSLPRGFTEVPGTAEIGYAVKGTDAVLVARKLMEVDCGHGLQKRYRVEVPIVE